MALGFPVVASTTEHPGEYKTCMVALVSALKNIQKGEKKNEREFITEPWLERNNNNPLPPTKKKVLYEKKYRGKRRQGIPTFNQTIEMCKCTRFENYDILIGNLGFFVEFENLYVVFNFFHYTHMLKDFCCYSCGCCLCVTR